VAWIESHADLRDHPKLDLLMELLGIPRRDAVGLLHFVWWRALTYAPSGDLSDMTDGQIARWADWDGDPGHLVSGLKTAGFIDSARTIHDWDDFAGRWIDRRKADAKRKKDARDAAANRANGTRPGTSGGHPPGRRPESGVPDLTGPDLTGPDIPPNPPQAVGAPLTRRHTRGRSHVNGAGAAAEPVSSLTPEEIAAWQQPRT
jgi:hypothetical protein